MKNGHGKPFRVSEAHIDWAHGSAAEDGQPLASELVDWPVLGTARRRYKLFTMPAHVAEIADVAELYVGGRTTDLRAASVRARAVSWLAARGLTVRKVVSAAHRAVLATDQAPEDSAFLRAGTSARLRPRPEGSHPAWRPSLRCGEWGGLLCRPTIPVRARIQGAFAA